MAKYGLIGKNIEYSFSKTFFTLKFEQDNRKDTFHNFDISDIRLLRTPFYETKLMTYIDKVVPQHPDSLILAVGQDTDTAFLDSVPGIEFDWDRTVKVDNNMMTGHVGIFAGGDMVPSDRSVTIAVGHGKHAARHIDAFLKDSKYVRGPRHDLIGHERLHLWYRTHAPQVEQDRLPLAEREGFDEILMNLSEAEALFEAGRCLSCGNCFECDGCYGACPQDAIIKLGKGKRYKFDFDKCTGCAVCFEQCPCHAIEMIDEPQSEEASA